MRKSRAQSTLEYATIITIVVGALTVMSTYVQRAIQANLKVIENQINSQPAVKTVTSAGSMCQGIGNLVNGIGGLAEEIGDTVKGWID